MSGNSAKWNFSTSKTNSENFEPKHKKQTKINNLKKVPTFENIFEKNANSNDILHNVHPLSSILSTREGLSGMSSDDTVNGATNTVTSVVGGAAKTVTTGATNAATTIATDAANDPTLNDIFNKVKSKTQSIATNLGSTLASNSSTLDNLKMEYSNIMEDIENLTNGNMLHYGADLLNPQNIDFNVENVINIKAINVDQIGGQIKTAFNSFGGIITNLLYKVIAQLKLIKIGIQYFILNWTNNVKMFITNLANAMTQKTATQTEIDTFQDQTQKLCTILLVWVFIYNWYYVVFFLEKGDGIRYTFNADDIYKYSPFLYGLIGPACRSVQMFNWLVVDLPALIKPYLPRSIIFWLMFLVFFILVSSNFQMGIITDFFNALNWKFGTSIISTIVFVIVVIYSLMFIFCSPPSEAAPQPNQYMNTSFVGSGAISMIFGSSNIITAILCFLGFLMFMVFYGIFTVTVNIPLGIFFISTYLVAYTFFAILMYEGFNSINILTAISEDISFIEPDVNDPSIFQWDRIPHYIYKFLKGTLNSVTSYMFEIIVLITLIGGIAIYAGSFKDVLNEKSIAGLVQNTSLSSAFKHLFTWLILINIIFICLIVVFMVQKYKYIQTLSKTSKMQQQQQFYGQSFNQNTSYSQPQSQYGQKQQYGQQLQYGQQQQYGQKQSQNRQY